MRIVGIATHSGRGGAQEALTRLVTELGRRGHEMDLWFLYGDGRGRDLSRSGRILVPTAASTMVDYARIGWAVVRELRAARPDAIISFMPLANVLSQTAGLACGVVGRVASQRGPAGDVHVLMRVLDTIAGSIGVYSCVVGNSRHVLQTFGRRPGPYVRRLRMVQNGLDWRPSRLTSAAARQHFGLPAEAPLVVNVGRLHALKNQSFLIRVVAGLPGVHLAIAGDGERYGMLRTDAAQLGLTGRVHFLRGVSQDRVPDLLRTADLFAFASLSEGQSNALLEAMWAGLPIVASDIPPNVETLTAAGGAQRAGLIVPPTDVAAWSQAIQLLLTDPVLRRRLAVRARSRAETTFQVGAMAQGFEAAIESAMAGVGAAATSKPSSTPTRKSASPSSTTARRKSQQPIS